MIIYQTCPICREETKIEVDGAKYAAWRSRQMLIQDAFPELSPVEREIIKTGYCKKHQEWLFAPPEEDEMGEEKDPCDIPDENGIFHCPFDSNGPDDCRRHCGLGVDE